MSAQDLLQAIKSGDYVKATEAFETAMSPKINDAIEAQKPTVAASFFSQSQDAPEAGE